MKGAKSSLFGAIEYKRSSPLFYQNCSFFAAYLQGIGLCDSIREAISLKPADIYLRAFFKSVYSIPAMEFFHPLA